MVYESCLDIDACLLEIKKNRNLGVAIGREHAKNTPVPITDSDMFCFTKSDNIFTFSVVMMMVKDFHLRAKINDLIRQISESGLLPKWQKESEIIRISDGSDSAGDGNIILKVEHVAGAFFLASIGWSIAILIFCLEWLIYWMSTKDYKVARKMENFFCFA